MNSEIMNPHNDRSHAQQKDGDAGAVDGVKPLKPYETPELICYGDVRDVTLGPTVGTGESGCEVLAPGPATLPCPF